MSVCIYFGTAKLFTIRKSNNTTTNNKQWTFQTTNVFLFSNSWIQVKKYTSTLRKQKTTSICLRFWMCEKWNRSSTHTHAFSYLSIYLCFDCLDIGHKTRRHSSHHHSHVSRTYTILIVENVKHIIRFTNRENHICILDCIYYNILGECWLSVCVSADLPSVAYNWRQLCSSDCKYCNNGPWLQYVDCSHTKIEKYYKMLGK